jgi:MoaA/NifB/PqqE/SkfB family radical SAM enzyme
MKEISKVLTNVPKTICIKLFEECIISWDGLVYPCCINLNTILGDLKKESLTKLWFEKLNQFRLFHIEGHPEKIPGCKGCSFIKDSTVCSSTLQENEVRDFLKCYNKGEHYVRDKSILTIEVSDRCNLICNMHQHKRFMKQCEECEDGLIDINLFRKILTELDSNNIHFNFLNLFWRGEPFLHPKLKEIFGVLNSLNTNNKLFDYVELHTHGQFLTPDYDDLLLNTPGLEITFSLDASNQEIYDKIRVGGDFNKVIDNIKRFTSKSSASHPFRRIFLQYIVQPANVEDLKSFDKFWTQFLKQEGKKYGYVTHNGRFDDPVKYSLLYKPLHGGTDLFDYETNKMIKIPYEESRDVYHTALSSINL